MAAPEIIEVHPASGASGVTLSDTISIIFDSEVDPTTISLFIEGPDTDRWSGPDLARWDDPTTTADDDILASPGYKGIVPGKLSFGKVDTEGNDVSGSDGSGGGTNWRTKAIFTPDQPLAPGVQYKVYIVGDEESTDEIQSGVSSRTVFDPIKGEYLGTGEVEFLGGYTGDNEDKYFVEILDTGAAGTVRFKWYKLSDPLTERVLTSSTVAMLLDQGVYVRFTGSDFQTGDIISAVVKPAERMQDTFIWLFTTGSGSIRAIPEEPASTAAAGIGGEGVITGALQIVSITPVEEATNLDPQSVTQIVVRFNKELDADTITDETVLIWTEPVNGDFENQDIQFAGTLAKVLSVDGDTLTIQIS